MHVTMDVDMDTRRVCPEANLSRQGNSIMKEEDNNRRN